MSAITFRLSDSKYDRLKKLAASQSMSVNKLLDELTTIALTSYDVKTRFDLRASKGSAEKGLDVLKKLKTINEK